MHEDHGIPMATARAYLNGQLLPLAEARVSVLDRGFLFGDGVYEVVPVYGGRPHHLERHLRRLAYSLQCIGIEAPVEQAEWRRRLQRLIEVNGGGDQSLYIQITRGAGPRRHVPPAGCTPTIFVMSRPLPAHDHAEAGLRVITRQDIRWARCDIKAITLLANVMLRSEADRAGADEAILLRDGQVTEGTVSNVFVVRDGRVCTPRKDGHILPGVTRDVVVELLRDAGEDCTERDIGAPELLQADEIWLTGSTLEVAPVITLDGVPVGTGCPGPCWRRAPELYQADK